MRKLYNLSIFAASLVVLATSEADAICNEIRELITLSEKKFESLKGKSESDRYGVVWDTSYKISNAYDCFISEDGDETEFTCSWVYSSDRTAYRNYYSMAREAERCVDKFLMRKADFDTRRSLVSHFTLHNDVVVSVSKSKRVNRHGQYRVRVNIVKEFQ